MASPLKNIANLFSDIRTRIIILLTLAILVFM